MFCCIWSTERETDNKQRLSNAVSSSLLVLLLTSTSSLMRQWTLPLLWTASIFQMQIWQGPFIPSMSSQAICSFSEVNRVNDSYIWIENHCKNTLEGCLISPHSQLQACSWYCREWKLIKHWQMAQICYLGQTVSKNCAPHWWWHWLLMFVSERHSLEHSMFFLPWPEKKKSLIWFRSH